MQYRSLPFGLAAALAALLALPATPALGQPDTAAAPLDGLWCGTGLLRGSSMRLAQHEQAFDGTLSHRGRERPLQGRIDGPMLRAESKRYGELAFAYENNEIRLAQAEGLLALARGTTFQRAPGERCS